MREYTVREYDKEDYDRQYDEMSTADVICALDAIKRKMLPPCEISGKEDDYLAHKYHVAMDRAISAMRRGTAIEKALAELKNWMGEDWSNEHGY